ncbi:Hypothetical protein POVN_LOCUS272 [uncultured virus]|nr:Hypothetical protein POVN_LOCUS272 [uncultured virus]
MALELLINLGARLESIKRKEDSKEAEVLIDWVEKDGLGSLKVTLVTELKAIADLKKEPDTELKKLQDALDGLQRKHDILKERCRGYIDADDDTYLRTAIADKEHTYVDFNAYDPAILWGLEIIDKENKITGDKTVGFLLDSISALTKIDATQLLLVDGDLKEMSRDITLNQLPYHIGKTRTYGIVPRTLRTQIEVLGPNMGRMESLDYVFKHDMTVGEFWEDLDRTYASSGFSVQTINRYSAKQNAYVPIEKAEDSGLVVDFMALTIAANHFQVVLREIEEP